MGTAAMGAVAGGSTGVLSVRAGPAPDEMAGRSASRPVACGRFPVDIFPAIVKGDPAPVSEILAVSELSFVISAVCGALSGPAGLVPLFKSRMLSGDNKPAGKGKRV
ncbi:MAG: hypothetical protein Kow0059_08330 [Candidatus Sumerlaeia bacterium]